MSAIKLLGVSNLSQAVKTKLMKVYLPFISVSLAFTVLYTFLHWLLIIKLQLFQPTEMIVNIIAPFVVSALIVYFYFKKKIKILKLKKKTSEFYSMMCWLFFVLPVIAGQFYLENQQGKLTKISEPSQINVKEQTLFYSIDHARALNERGGLWTTRTRADRYGTKIRISCYFVCPLIGVERSSRHRLRNVKTWIGVKFIREFSNGFSVNKKKQKEQIKKFIESCILRYADYKYETYYLRNLRMANDRDEFYSAIKRTHLQANQSDLLVLEEESGSYETRVGHGAAWSWGLLVFVNFIWLFFAFIPDLDIKELNKLDEIQEEEPKSKREEFLNFLKLFIPSKELKATPILVDLNLLLFLAMVLSGVSFLNPQGSDLLGWGANFKLLTMNGQWYRLIVSIFIHAGVIHLLYNMFALLLVGAFIESSVGSRTFATIYLLSGVIANIFSLEFHKSSVLVGASGAIFGMYGLMVALMLLKYLNKKITKTLWISISVFIGANLVIGLANSGIDMYAHLGGLLSGFIIGITYFPFERYLDKLNKQ